MSTIEMGSRSSPTSIFADKRFWDDYNERCRILYGSTWRKKTVEPEPDPKKQFLDPVTTQAVRVSGDVSSVIGSVRAYTIEEDAIMSKSIAHFAAKAPSAFIAPFNLRNEWKLVSVSKRVGDAWGRALGVLSTLKGLSQALHIWLQTSVHVISTVAYFTGAAASLVVIVGAMAQGALFLGLVLGLISIIIQVEFFVTIRDFRNQIAKMSDRECLEFVQQQLKVTKEEKKAIIEQVNSDLSIIPQDRKDKIREDIEALRQRKEARLGRKLSQELINDIKKARCSDAALIAARVRQESKEKYLRALTLLLLVLSSEAIGITTALLTGNVIYVLLCVQAVLATLFWLKFDSEALVKAMREVDVEQRNRKVMLLCALCMAAGTISSLFIGRKNVGAQISSFINGSVAVSLYLYCCLKLNKKNPKK